MNTTASVSYSIPNWMYSTDLAQLIDGCRLSGLGNGGTKKWTDPELGNAKVLYNFRTFQTITSLSLETITKQFGKNFKHPTEWERVVKDSYQNYQELLNLMKNTNVDRSALPRRFPINASGYWLYGLVKFDGSKYENDANAILGYFQISDFEITNAKSHRYFASKSDDTEKLQYLNDWTSNEVSVGHNMFHVRYVANRHQGVTPEPAGIFGLISAKMANETALFGATPCTGDYYDLNIGRDKFRGYFYAERLIEGVGVELNNNKAIDMLGQNAAKIYEVLKRKIKPQT